MGFGASTTIATTSSQTPPTTTSSQTTATTTSSQTTSTTTSSQTPPTTTSSQTTSTTTSSQTTSTTTSSQTPTTTTSSQTPTTTTSSQTTATTISNQTLETPDNNINETSSSPDLTLPTTNDTDTTGPYNSAETTLDPGISATTVPEKTTTKNSTTSKPTICTGNICGNQSICLQLANMYVCQCPLNYYYNEGALACDLGESFFGDLKVTKAFNPSQTSDDYTAIYTYVIDNFKKCFTSSGGYKETVVLDMQLAPSRAQTRDSRNTNDVSVKVSHLFTRGATDADAVTSAVKNYVTANPNFGTYAAATICDNGIYCDPETTTCAMSGDGQSAICACKDGTYSLISPYTYCRDCPPTCGESEGQYCKQEKSSDLPTCTCSAGYKPEGDKCKKCDFGYSGENCDDNFLLILVIVGAVLGAAVISLIGAVIGVCVKSKKGVRDNEETELITKPDKLSGEGSPVPRALFPKVRAKPNLGQDNMASTVYEEEESYARSIPQRDYEENPWYEMAKKDRQY
ncbi:mucin-13 isoform X2 [Mixophyes fleayi]|uniref:mucin-13 isoform X2 n=1 Tax=Mixophyes fleayi TaxID=3061075 RepID=UPI003F4E140D